MGQKNQQTAETPNPTLLYLYFLPTAHFLKTILDSQTNGSFGFAPTAQADTQAKPKEPLFANTPNK